MARARGHVSLIIVKVRNEQPQFGCRGWTATGSSFSGLTVHQRRNKRGSADGRKQRVELFDTHQPVSYLVWIGRHCEAPLSNRCWTSSAACGAATRSVDRILDRAGELGVQVDWSLETHVHADHLSAAQRVREQTGARTVIGAGVTDVQRHFASLFGIDIAGDGSEFDQLVADGARLPG